LTNAPVRQATPTASALCPTGKVRPCLAISSAVVASPSADRATTLIPVSARLPGAGFAGRPRLILLNAARPPFDGSAGFSFGHLAAR